jgi:CubicO group peptidase (beta-lactamase class C family)
MANSDWDKTKFVTNQDIFNFLVNRKAELLDLSAPNTHFSYSNTNFALLALLIEKVSGIKYATFLKQAFFIPLQMKNTFVFDLSDSTTSLRSYDWRGRLEPYDFLDEVYGDKNIYTTPRDLLIWDRALTSNVLFKTETLEQAYAPYSNEKAGVRNYGLGWRMYVYPDGKKIIYHNGRWHGTNAAFIRLISDKATIIVIGNRYNRSIYHAKVLASLFGDYFGEIDEEEAAVADRDSVLRASKNTIKVDSVKTIFNQEKRGMRVKNGTSKQNK